MNILFLNNYFYLRGGSERVFFGEMDLLKKKGHEITGFARNHPEDHPSPHHHFFPPDMATDRVRFSWDAIRSVGEMLYSRSAKKSLELMLKEVKPDIVHVHNMYGRLTTSVLDVLSQHKLPVVMTLHDHKLICPTYRCMRNEQVCEDCGNGKFFMAVLNRCHKNSYAASAIVAFESYYCTWFDKYLKNVMFFISPSCFLKNKLVEFGWPENRIKILPNFISLEEFTPDYTPGNYFLYLGRLSEEKGIGTLVQAFKNIKDDQAKLVIVGDGPLRKELENLAENDNRIQFTGYLSGNELHKRTREAKVLIIPSECYENAPLSVIEAMAYGKPVIGSMTGGIPEMVMEGETGFLFQAGDVHGLTDKMERVLSLGVSEIERLGMAARKTVETKYTQEAHYRELMKIYEEVLSL
ncbi:MAG: glycosyltransferase family 4 protein [Pseudomonadota bacterium]